MNTNSTQVDIGSLKKEIYEHARSLAKEVYPDPTLGVGHLITELGLRHHLDEPGRKALKRVQVWTRTRCTVSRMMIGGIPFIVGLFENFESAVRHADVATLMFWKYRSRSPALPDTDRDFNLDLNQAERDLALTDNICVMTLRRIEEILLRSGVITAGKPTQVRRSYNKTLRGTVDKQFFAVNNEISNLVKEIKLLGITVEGFPERLDALYLRVEGAEKAFCERLESLEKKLDAILSANDL